MLETKERQGHQVQLEVVVNKAQEVQQDHQVSQVFLVRRD